MTTRKRPYTSANRIASALLSILLFLSLNAAAANVRYSYSTTAVFDESGLFFTTGQIASGAFDYDASIATPVVSPAPSVYQAFSNLTGLIDGKQFADATGPVAVWNNSFSAGPFMNNDAFVLATDGSANDLTGFQLTSGGLTYELKAVRLRWLSLSDFLATESLPAVLPPTSGGEFVLEFINIADSSDFFDVKAAFSNLQPVPVPGAIWLFGSALGLLGWMRRRKT